jgi:hypothetical protein
VLAASMLVTASSSSGTVVPCLIIEVPTLVLVELELQILRGESLTDKRRKLFLT